MKYSCLSFIILLWALLLFTRPAPVRANADHARPPAQATPTPAALYQGLPAGFTAEGHPMLGDPAAPLTLTEFSDFLCPFCQRHFQQTYPLLLEKHIRTGQVRLVFRQFPIPSLHPTAPLGAAASLCMAQQSAVLFWAMHDALFTAQSAWQQLAAPEAYLTDLAVATGADRKQFQTCMTNPAIQEAVQQEMAAGTALGFNATPSFLVSSANDDTPHQLVGALPFATFQEWFEALRAGQEPPTATEPPQPALPFWANQEGRAPDPQRPGYTRAGDPYKGAADAPITVIEFSDFQCPACATHNNTVQPAIDQALIEQGKVRWVFKHFPVREHALAPLAAAAVECAAAQGAFWPMHDRLFADQTQWATHKAAAAETAFIKFAAALGLHRQTFTACLDSRQALEPVLADLLDGQGFIQQTPTFIILDQETGTLVKGSRTATDFIALLQSFVERSNP